MSRTLAILAAALLTGCAADYNDRGAPGSNRRIALDTLDRSDVHCVGQRHISCHTHLDGVPSPSVYRERWRNPRRPRYPVY
jgi:hypothetical protein